MGFAQQVAADGSGAALHAPASGAALSADPSAQSGGERFAIHGQATYLQQLTSPFHAPYSGPNSLSPRHGAETFDMTLFVGARLWSGAEAWINPEIDQGFGLDNTLGVAGFPSGTAYKVGRSHPYWRLPRLFLRQTIDLAGDLEPVEATANQLGGSQSSNRWVFTAGKISVPDIFDSNQYAHDPRNDFLNWAAVDAGSFDYAADSWGFTVGAAAEWYQGAWTLRAGVFDLSNVPNSEALEHGFHEVQWVGEVERRHELMERPGKVLMTLFDTRGRMALLNDAVSLAQATGESVNETLVAVRSYRSRTGVSLNLEQQLSSDLGMFARAGKAGGEVEVYEFTDIDRTISAGLSLKGSRWGRADDTVGLAAIANYISAAREQYLNAGGLGILVGDGQLPHPGSEQILETYYRLAAVPWAQLTLDYQYVVNPAYNTDRGPVSIFAVRVHAQF
ncbi:MAG TPA: carbohydrate porin [Stellaceae bacterium]|nr:carbohydrate porin [Stellaceae bacterium]